MFLLVFLTIANVLCGCTLSVLVDTQQLTHGRSIREASGLSNDKNHATEMNIAFDLPDITTTLELPSETVHLEAFKSVDNDKLLQEKSEVKSSQLFWVSIGHPNFVKTNGRENDMKLFHVTNKGFSTYVEMMTARQRKSLAFAAQNKYKVNISDSQMVHLILSKFHCTLLMYNAAGDKYLIRGNISDFRHFPLRMDFDARPKSPERELFLKMVNASEDDLDFDCRIESSGGKLVKSNTLTITAERINQIGLEEKLFGPTRGNGSNDVFITRNQMSELAHEMYSTLNIVEDYQMPESQFSEEFVGGLISQLSSSQFSQLPIDDVLSSLSKYGFDIGADLQPDVIKRDAGSILKVEDRGDKSHIIVDESQRKAMADKYSGSYSVGIKLIGVSVKAAADMEKRSESDGRSLNDQLKELNTASENEAQWEIEGNRVVPKNLSVARLTRSKMKTPLTFNRIRLQTFRAPFERNFKIYTSRSVSSDICQNVSSSWQDTAANSNGDLTIAMNTTALTLKDILAAVEGQNTAAISNGDFTIAMNTTTLVMKDILAAVEDLKIQMQETRTIQKQLLDKDPCGGNLFICDCSTIRANNYTASGVYRIYVDHQYQRYYANAFCDMTTENRSWTVFQRRKDGSEDFYRGWNDYADGFGNPNGEYWLGNDFLHMLTSKRRYRLRIDLEDFGGGKEFAEYSTFNISSASDSYRLKIGTYSGNAGDSLTYHNGIQFSTKDSANPSCARSIFGAWWYDNCAHSSLNGQYIRGSRSPGAHQGVFWYYWINNWSYSLKASEMKISHVA